MKANPSTITVAGVVLVRPRTAAWDAPWSCKRCGAATPSPSEPPDVAAWVTAHAKECR